MQISADMISAIAPRRSVSEDVSPEEAFREFEAFLLAEVLKDSQRPLGGSHSLDGGSAGQLYREQFADALAARISEAGGVGIATRLMAQARAKSGDDRG